LNGKISDDKRHEILIWALDLDIEKDQLKSIPPDYFFAFLSLVYLNQNDSMTKAEAMGCLKTLIQEKNHPIPENIEYPENVNSRALRVSSNFVKIFRIFQCCFTSIGFKNYNVSLKSNYFNSQSKFNRLNPSSFIIIQFTSYNFQYTVPKFEDWKFEDLEIVKLHMRKP
jgi:hypothetical protein